MKKIFFALLSVFVALSANAETCRDIANKRQKCGYQIYGKFIFVPERCELPNQQEDDSTVWQCNSAGGGTWTQISRNSSCNGGTWVDVSSGELVGSDITAYGKLQRCSAAKTVYRYVENKPTAPVMDGETSSVKTSSCSGMSGFTYSNGTEGNTECSASMPGIDPTNTNACRCTCDNGAWKDCMVEQCKPGYNYVWKNGKPMACTKSFGGEVVDRTGEPLVGASLVAKSDKETYVFTDENGKFSFPTDMTTDDNLFLVQYVGCKDKEVKLTANMRIVMSCGEELDEAVVKPCTDEELFEIRAKTGQYMSDKGLCVAMECIEGAEKVVKNGVEQGNCDCPEGTEFKKGDKPKNSVCEKINLDIQKCNETTNAHWDEEAKECKCVEGMYLKEVENIYFCLPVLDDNIEIDDVEIEVEDISFDFGDDPDLNFVDPRIAQCNAKSGAKWNATTKECECADKVNTKWNSDKSACVDTDDARAARATLNISSSIATIKSVTSGLKQSAWKTEDGKFNTARLASDSIAGVILGTAGGLITSSVVKKHQVKEGFEDIKCAIGGQNVADWGDEFNVGVK